MTFLSEPHQAFYREDGTAVCQVTHGVKTTMRIGRTMEEAYEKCLDHFTLFDRMTMRPNGLRGRLRILEVEIEALRRALRAWQRLSIPPPSY